MATTTATTIELASHVLATALRTRSSVGLAKVERQLVDLAASDAPEWEQALTGLADVCRAARELEELRGLAPPARALEPGSLPARLLSEIERGARVGNADLAGSSARTPGR